MMRGNGHTNFCELCVKPVALGRLITTIFPRIYARTYYAHPRARVMSFSIRACSMPKVKLGRKKFDVDSEEINASGCGVSDADCVAFAARMRTGEISRVKILNLVSFFFVVVF